MGTAKKTLSMGLVFSAVLLGAWADLCRAEYPERPITLICNNTPGGGKDLINRAIAKYAEPLLGQPVIVVNKPGASATLATGLIASAKPDGYTIGDLTYTPLAMAPHMFDVPYDPLTAFEYFMGYAKFRYGFFVKSDSPFKTFQELIGHAKANPHGVKVSVFGQGTPHHLAMVSIAKATGITWDIVHMQGGVESTTALLGGHVDANSQVADVIVPYLKAGRVRMLACMDTTRWPWAPEVPTLKEMGYNIVPKAYMGFGTHRAVPKPIIEKWRDICKQAMGDKKFLELMESFYWEPEYLSPEQYRKIIEEGYKEDGEFMKQLGIHKSQKKKS